MAKSLAGSKEKIRRFTSDPYIDLERVLKGTNAAKQRYRSQSNVTSALFNNHISAQFLPLESA